MSFNNNQGQQQFQQQGGGQYGDKPDPDFYVRVKSFTNSSTGEVFAAISGAEKSTGTIYQLKMTRAFKELLANAGINLGEYNDAVLFTVTKKGYVPKSSQQQQAQNNGGQGFNNGGQQGGFQNNGGQQGGFQGQQAQTQQRPQTNFGGSFPQNTGPQQQTNGQAPVFSNSDIPF